MIAMRGTLRCGCIFCCISKSFHGQTEADKPLAWKDYRYKNHARLTRLGTTVRRGSVAWVVLDDVGRRGLMRLLGYVAGCCVCADIGPAVDVESKFIAVKTVHTITHEGVPQAHLLTGEALLILIPSAHRVIDHGEHSRSSTFLRWNGTVVDVCPLEPGDVFEILMIDHCPTSDPTAFHVNIPVSRRSSQLHLTLHEPTQQTHKSRIN